VNALTDEEPAVLTASSIEEELDILEKATRIFDNESVILVGHNIKGFDIPFLAKRYLARKKFIPKTFQVVGKKPWEIPHIDTMELMRFGGGASMSLRSACLLLGIEDPKGSVCGSEVPQMFREGKVDTIGEYCKGDVIAERELYKRIMRGLD
jgi:predicted PolB exonuclease-like 3'-5' exonuclease